MATQINSLSQTLAQFIVATNGNFSVINQQLININGALTALEDETNERLEALEGNDTYTVTFYDSQNAIIATYLVKQGDSVNPPDENTYTDSLGYAVTFPYMPASDAKFYRY